MTAALSRNSHIVEWLWHVWQPHGQHFAQFFWCHIHVYHGHILRRPDHGWKYARCIHADSNTPAQPRSSRYRGSHRVIDFSLDCVGVQTTSTQCQSDWLQNHLIWTFTWLGAVKSYRNLFLGQLYSTCGKSPSQRPSEVMQFTWRFIIPEKLMLGWSNGNDFTVCVH